MSDVWTREEVEATVAEYFDMVEREQSGPSYIKREHFRQLALRTNNTRPEQSHNPFVLYGLEPKPRPDPAIDRGLNRQSHGPLASNWPLA